MPTQKTIVGRVHPEILAFTVGDDPRLDAVLVEADCIASAAHVTMLTRPGLKPPIIRPADGRKIITTLVEIMRKARQGGFVIRRVDQDVHLAIERFLTRRLGDLGRRVHTGRSRNDQAAVDLRLYGKEQLLAITEDMAALATVLLRQGRRWSRLPMVGRTHFRPAMPSSVGLWLSGYAEGLLDDLIIVRGAYDYVDRSPLGSAAGYGVALPLNRQLTARLLGFKASHRNVFHAGNTRGKCEAVVLMALGQVMLTLSRLAEDLILFSSPEFGYFSFPPEYGTGSSIMPQKNNPDVLELIRAKAATLLGYANAVNAVVLKLPGGYNRDLQETKRPFVEGLATTRACLRIMTLLLSELTVNRRALLAGFTPEVFATDRAVELVRQGWSFRAAYDYVKIHLDELRRVDPCEVLAKRPACGCGRADLAELDVRLRAAKRFVKTERAAYYRAVSRLLGTSYPELE